VLSPVIPAVFINAMRQSPSWFRKKTISGWNPTPVIERLSVELPVNEPVFIFI
jgi:hypothetical protein